MIRVEINKYYIFNSHYHLMSKEYIDTKDIDDISVYNMDNIRLWIISSNDNIFNELKESVYKIKIEYGLFPIINIYIDEDKSLFREFRMNEILFHN